jgi:WD40 repeat protein
MKPFHIGGLLLGFALAATTLYSQERCPLPPSPFSAEANIFNAQQEMDLGDAAAQQVERSFHLVSDAELNGRLQALGDRLIKNLPRTDMRYRFVLFDEPVLNAWGLPGGRIYVSRKMVAFTKDEEELAGLLAHEIGHIYTHQQAIDYTRWFKDYLGITSVGDRQDIFTHYQQLVDNTGRRRMRHGEERERREQAVADQLALYALARAGYDPQSYARFWDRLAETHGKTGGFFSDLFGNTPPESRRLREILKNAGTMPGGCIDRRAAGSDSEFKQWQASVIAYSGYGKKEELRGVRLRQPLEPPLQSDFSELRFSPDGKYLLAMDDAGISVLSVEPLKFLFRIPTEDAREANFSPDSTEIVFHTRSLRVERWDVAGQKRVAVNELALHKPCLDSALSPDGKLVACYDTDFNLSLLDVGTAAPIFQKKEFHSFWTAFTLVLIGRLTADDEDIRVDLLPMKFSPEGRYFVVATRYDTLVYDTEARATISVPGKVRDWLTAGYGFMSGGRIAAIAGQRGEKSVVARFPTGDVLSTITLGDNRLSGATKGDYLLLRPIAHDPVGVLDIHQNKLILGNHKAALDVYEDLMASEAKDGEVLLSRITATGIQTVSEIALPRAPLGRLRAVAVSDDLKQLAFSQRSRGAVFDLDKGRQVFLLRGFRGVYFDKQGAAFADFPQFEEHGQKRARNVAEMKISDGSIQQGPDLAEDLRAWQCGPYFVVRIPKKKWAPLGADITLEVRELRSGTPVWSRNIAGTAPRIFSDASTGVITLQWEATENGAREGIRSNPQLQRQYDKFPDKKGIYYLEVLELATGKKLGQLLIDTGNFSFWIRDVTATRDYALVTDTENRVLVYSLRTGEQQGKVFGGPAELSPQGLASVSEDRGTLAVVDLKTMQKRSQLTFPSPVAYSRFTPDGTRLFVLTKDQTAYVLEVPSESAVAADPSQ